jgi:hypothetical protein
VNPSLTGTEAIRSVRVALPSVPASAAKARAAVAELEDAAHPEVLATARLLVTELVATAISGSPHEQIEVTIELTQERLRCEVHAGEAAHAEPGEHLPRQPTGWSLFLVKRLAAKWAIDPDGSTVWFEVKQRPWPRRRAKR